MTTLSRTQLSIPQKIEFALASISSQGKFGAISDVSRTYDISRPTVYETAKATSVLLTQYFEQGSSISVEVNEAQLNRAIVGLRAIAPNSIRDIEELLPIIYPGIKISYGSIQSELKIAEERAKKFNDEIKLANIEAGALDEMFSQGEPVLAGIDLQSGLLFNLDLREGRTGKDWEEVLKKSKAQGLNLEIVVKDSAPGIALGVKEVFPECEQRDDCFHILYKLNKFLRTLEARAYNAIKIEQESLEKLNKMKKKGEEVIKEQKLKVEKAQQYCQQLVLAFDQFETAKEMIEGSFEFMDMNKKIFRTGQDVKELFIKASELIGSIDYKGCKPLAVYIRNRAEGASLATYALENKLNEIADKRGFPLIISLCLFLQSIFHLQKKKFSHKQNEIFNVMINAYSELKYLSCENLQLIMKEVMTLIENRYRASSAIEGFNAALRPYLYVHKGATQGFLDLFRAYYNLRNRRFGRHKNTSAYEVLTGKKIGDWLTCIGYPPSKILH